MPNEPPNQEDVAALRGLLAEYVKKRLKPKLEDIEKGLAKATAPDKKAELEAKRDKLLEEYQPAAWLASAANRAGQLQYVTHVDKFTHPSATGKGGSLAFEARHGAWRDPLVGTWCLGNQLQSDAVGNAAALDVHGLLIIEYQGRTLLARILAGDPAMAAALDDDPERAAMLMNGFAAIAGSGKTPVSHTLTRQVYFPLSGGGYHLLAPLFHTSLVQAVHISLREARFSEKAKEAHQARKDGKSHPVGYSDFPGMVVQAFGGTKPQNISQLNAERHGENWLLPSLPPNWVTKPVRPPMKNGSVFRRIFGNRSEVRELTGHLANLLSSTSYNNKNIRNARAALVDSLCDQLLQFAAELRQLNPGWSADPACRLDMAEALWLDPERAATDEDFAALRGKDEWQEEVASRFGHWLNRRLERLQKGPIKLHMGDDEHAEWKKLLVEALNGVRKELHHG